MGYLPIYYRIVRSENLVNFSGPGWVPAAMVPLILGTDLAYHVSEGLWYSFDARSDGYRCLGPKEKKWPT